MFLIGYPKIPRPRPRPIRSWEEMGVDGGSRGGGRYQGLWVGLWRGCEGAVACTAAAGGGGRPSVALGDLVLLPLRFLPFLLLVFFLSYMLFFF